METKFKFEKLIIWQKAMSFSEAIVSISDDFPKKEMYNLSSQICRAADSIALNISEGSIGQSNPEFRKFKGYLIRTLVEVISCLHKANQRNYISETEFNKLYEESFHLMNMMIGFKNKIK